TDLERTMLERVIISLYVGVGFFLISATHSYYCKYFHDRKKRFGYTFFEGSGPILNYKYGYITSLFLGILSSSLFINYFIFAFDNFPASVSDGSIRWLVGLFLLGGFLLFIASPYLGGGAALKWVLEGSLMLFTLLLILSIPVDETVFDQVQFVFSVTGAVLAAIYLRWLDKYILPNLNKDASNLRDVLDTFENDSRQVWALFGTVAYYVFSGVYILIGYLFVFSYIN
ncbi:hypothetical protein, partial [Haloquadratum walsbyi]